MLDQMLKIDRRVRLLALFRDDMFPTVFPSLDAPPYVPATPLADPIFYIVPTAASTTSIASSLHSSTPSTCHTSSSIPTTRTRAIQWKQCLKPTQQWRERGPSLLYTLQKTWYNECSVYMSEKSRIVTSPLLAPMTTFCPQQAMRPPCPRLCGSQHIRRWPPSSARRDNHPVLLSNSKAGLLPFGSKIISVVE
jgi:hypothetical protein